MTDLAKLSVEELEERIADAKGTVQVSRRTATVLHPASRKLCHAQTLEAAVTAERALTAHDKARAHCLKLAAMQLHASLRKTLQSHMVSGALSPGSGESLPCMLFVLHAVEQ